MYSREEKLAAKRIYLRLWAEFSSNHLLKRTHEATKIPIRTLRRWIHEWRCESTVPVTRPTPRRLNSELKLRILTFVRERIERFFPVTFEIIKRAFPDHNLHASTISRLLKKHGISSQKTQIRAENRCSAEYLLEVENYRAAWAAEDLSNVWVLDESGIWNNHVVPRSYSFVGRSPQVRVANTSRRDTIIACLCGSGQKLPPKIIVHTKAKYKKKQIVTPAVKGVNERIFLEYIQEFLVPNLPRGSILMMDNLSVHKTPAVLQSLHHAGIQPIFFPVRSACDLSPCDNSFFHSLKQRLRKMDLSTQDLKFAAIYKAYDSITPKSVRGFFRKCGLLLVSSNESSNSNSI